MIQRNNIFFKTLFFITLFGDDQVRTGNELIWISNLIIIFFSILTFQEKKQIQRKQLIIKTKYPPNPLSGPSSCSFTPFPCYRYT